MRLLRKKLRKNTRNDEIKANKRRGMRETLRRRDGETARMKDKGKGDISILP